MKEALVIIIGYLLGSIPTAYLAGRITRGVDIRKSGQNLGALTTLRDVGRGAGIMVLIVDFAKGGGGVLIARYVGVGDVWTYLAGFAAIIGHCWPVFLKFRGGKGAATTNGVFLTLAPIQFLLAFPLFILILVLTRNVVLGMTFGFMLYPALLWVFGKPFSLIIFAILTSIFLGLRYFPSARKSWRSAGSLKNFIIEKQFGVWQTRKKGK
jgi:acyl phosphate:glycerol-3-phosphate acyltransferase